MDEAARLIENFKDLYPDEMVLTEMSEFERGKKAGMVQLLQEMEEFIKGDDDAHML